MGIALAERTPLVRSKHVLLRMMGRCPFCDVSEVAMSIGTGCRKVRALAG